MKMLENNKRGSSCYTHDGKYHDKYDGKYDTNLCITKNTLRLSPPNVPHEHPCLHASSSMFVETSGGVITSQMEL